MKTKILGRIIAQMVSGVLCLSFCFAFAKNAEGVSFNMLSCCPGENTARQARFVWHSSADNCLLFCAKATDPAGDVHTILPYGKTKKPVAFRSSDVSYYKYSAEISDLEPGTEYVYWVESGSEKSPVQKFRTAGTSGSYNFLWLSDVHSYPGNPGKMDTVELLRKDAEARTAASGGIDFVLFSGDAVKFGSRYDNWQQWNGSPSVTNYTFAMVPGNKEYYYTGSDTFYDYYWYLAVKNNPPNGPDATEQEGCYWFLRDSVLFVGIDSLIHKGSRMSMYNKKSEVLTAQTNWFDRVVTSQRGKFRYLVVVQHDPWFVYAASKDSFDKSRGNYDVWRHVFDKHKVDLALSGDEHNYIRSKPLRGDAANSDGTVYMVAGQIEESNYTATITKDISSYGNANATKYFDCMGASDASCGAAWIEVRPTSLKVTEYWDKYQSPNYEQYDSFEITPKNRGWTYEAIGERAHTRYRFSVDAPRSDSGKMQLSEIQLLDANGNVIQPSEFTLAWDSTTTNSAGQKYPSGENPGLAADGKLNTKWLDYRAGLDNPADVRAAAWLEFRFSSPTKISGYRWYTANDDKSYPGRTPVSWTLSAFDEDSEMLYILDRVEGYNPPKENKVLAYPLPEDPDEPEEPADPGTPAATNADGTYYVLSEGVNKYKDDWQGKLTGCVPDAHNVLSACTNGTYGLWNPQNCVGFYDSDVTWAAVRAQLNSFAEVAKSGDTVLYYHSSHGGDDCICLYDREYCADELAEDLMRFKTGVRVVVVLDTCHSGSMFKDGSGVDPESGPWRFAASVQELMDEMKSVQTKGAKAAAANGPTVGWVTACDDDQTSLDVGSGGWFTNPFVAAWKSNSTDANGDGFNDFKEIFNIAAPKAIDTERAPQTMNESLLRSVAAWNISGTIGGHGKWIGGSGDNRFSIAANWGDNRVPSTGDALDFSSVSTATAIEADVNATFGAVTMGTGVVTFTGGLSATSFSDTSKIAVGENATVTLNGDLIYTETAGGGWMLNRLDGVFVVTGKIVVSGSADMKLAQSIGANGVAVAEGLVSNGGTPWTFRLNRSDSGDTARWVIGEEGLSGNSGFWMLAMDTSSSAIIQPRANDFTIADWIGVRVGPLLTIDTTGWVDDAPHVITATAGFLREGVVSVVGTGTLVCDYDASSGAYDQNINSVAFNVGGSATLALAAGSNIGTGGVTVGSGAALATTGAGTATIGGSLSLQSGSRFVVGAALNVASVSLPASGTVNVSFSTEPAVNTATTILSITGSQTLAASDLAKFSLPDGYVLSLGSGGKSIAVTRYCGTWTGGMALSVPSGGLSIGAAGFDVSDASRENPITVTIGDGGELAGGSSSMVLSAGSFPETSPAAYMVLSNEVPDGYAAQFTTVGSAIYVNVVPVKWIEENAEKTYLTGRWSDFLEYGTDGKADIAGENVFTPYSVSTGNVVTIETKTVFHGCDISREPESDIQAAVCLSTNGTFQVWTPLGNNARWIDVAAEGVTPVSGHEYTLRVTIDYTANKYSVEIKDDPSSAFAKLSTAGQSSFALAYVTNCVSEIRFDGSTKLTSIAGESVEATGFGEYEEVALNGSSLVLDAAKAAWLNKLGAKAAVSGALASVTADKLQEAYLLNIDFTQGDFTYEFDVTDIIVRDASVEIKVTLKRNGTPGPDGAAINGTLTFYGASTIEAFKNAPSKIGTTTLDNGSFGDGDTATGTIELKGETPPAFFNVKVE